MEVARRSMTGSALIGLDWGTTSLRAYRIDADGAALERRELAAGILQVEHGDFAAALNHHIGDWLAADQRTPVLACGMIGSRQGWIEVPYATCPCGAAEIARGLATVELASGRRVHLLPGVTVRDAATGIPDVIRGEETQILGELALRGVSDGNFVLPGTHSKWVSVAAGGITGFRTYMTGEVFEALRRHTILARLMPPAGEEAAHNPAAFARGVARGADAAGDLLHSLFSTRTLGLFGDLPAHGLPSYLSGLLIGSELASAKLWLGRDPVVVIGSSRLTELYLAAMQVAEIEAAAGHADIVAHGLSNLARAARLTEDSGA